MRSSAQAVADSEIRSRASIDSTLRAKHDTLSRLECLIAGEGVDNGSAIAQIYCHGGGFWLDVVTSHM
jgi:hypothetical protein